MGQKGKTMWRRYKKYDEAFRRQVVNELMNGTGGYAELTKRYGLTSGLLTQWAKRYGVEAPVEGEEPHTRELRVRVAELERMIGRLAMENDFLKKFAAFTKQQTNERLSIVTPRNWAPPKPAGSLGSPEARTITDPGAAPVKSRKILGLKNGLKP
jgi:transposase-like protein